MAENQRCRVKDAVSAHEVLESRATQGLGHSSMYAKKLGFHPEAFLCSAVCGVQRDGVDYLRNHDGFNNRFLFACEVKFRIVTNRSIP